MDIDNGIFSAFITSLLLKQINLVLAFAFSPKPNSSNSNNS